MHKFIKLAGCKSEDEFYSKYKTEEAFFKKFPNARYVNPDGQAAVEQNQTLPPNRDSEESLKFTNVTTEHKKPPYKKGGKVKHSEYCKECGGYVKMQEGGDPFTNNYVHLFDQNGRMSFTPDTMPKPRVETEYYQRQMVANPITGVGEIKQVRVPHQVDPTEHYGISTMPTYNYDTPLVTSQPIVSNNGPAIGSENYSIDRVREQNPYEYKKGGKWIQGAVKHPGRCTPGSPNYDCPKGSPQWNLAQTFKKHHGFHKKQDGGPMELFPTHPGIVDTIQGAPDQQFNATPENINRTSGFLANDSTTMDQIYGYRNNAINPDPNASVRNAKYTNNIPGVTPEYITPGPGDGMSSYQIPSTSTHKKINPWAVGATALGSIAGTVMGYANLQSNLNKQNDWAQFQRDQGLTSNKYTAHVGSGSQGDYGQVGQGYGVFRPTEYTPSKGGNRMAEYGGRIEGSFVPRYTSHGTWAQDYSTYFQEGGQMADGFSEGAVIDIPENVAKALIRKGYKLEFIPD